MGVPVLVPTVAPVSATSPLRLSESLQQRGERPEPDDQECNQQLPSPPGELFFWGSEGSSTAEPPTQDERNNLDEAPLVMRVGAWVRVLVGFQAAMKKDGDAPVEQGSSGVVLS